MKKLLVIFGLIQWLLVPPLLFAVEVAPALTDREIIERLTRLEEGQNTLRAEIRANAEAIKQLRVDMNAQFDRVDAQLDRIVRLMQGMLGAFAAIVVATIGFALWDRRTMIRPFETKVKQIEEEISQNRQKLHALIETLRTLSQTDERVAEVLRKFHLL